MKDKFGLIEEVTQKLNELAESTGIKKSMLVVETFQLLLALVDNLKAEDEAHKAEKKLLEEQIKLMQKQQLGDLSEDSIGGETIRFDLVNGTVEVQEENQNGTK